MTQSSIDQTTDYLSAREASALLDVKLATLYAYTSRGLVRSIPGERGRARLYLRRDLERLRARRDARAGHGPVAAAALQFGEPVLDSSITEISLERGPLYRGQVAVELAEADAGFESVAELLWGSRAPDADDRDDLRELWQTGEFGVPIDALRDLLPPGAPPVAALAVVVPSLACRDPGRFAERPEAVIPRARLLIRRMAAALALGLDKESVDEGVAASLGADSIARAVATSLGGRVDERSVSALNRALVLGADHELNASTFAARVAASTGADIYACVAAALASLSGPRHGGASDRVEALVAEIGEPEAAERVVHERQRRGEAVEGFGHPLYPDGDPRGAALLELARSLTPATTPVRTCLALIDAMESGGAGGASIDVGLVALGLALELPRGAAVGLFAISRCVGWVAHVLEQYEAGYLVRPRARYLGPA
jgi:citrate synthase